MKTYNRVRHAYNAFFTEFKIPFLVAEADSGDIGGDLSHEYHFITPNGEDNIISCISCGFVTNEEMMRDSLDGTERGKESDKSKLESDDRQDRKCQSWVGISKDCTLMVEAVFPTEISVSNGSGTGFRSTELDPYAIKSLFPDLDLGIEHPIKTFIDFWGSARGANAKSAKEAPRLPSLVQVFDYRISEVYIAKHTTAIENTYSLSDFFSDAGLAQNTSDASPDLIRIGEQDPCPKCQKGALKIQKAVELGHTFYLGNRYSKPLEATITPNHGADLVHDNRENTASPSTLKTETSNKPYRRLPYHCSSRRRSFRP